MGVVDQSWFDARSGAPLLWPRPRNADGLPLPWTTDQVAQPDDVHYDRMERAHAAHLCQVCGHSLSEDNCYTVTLGTSASEPPGGNTVVEGAGLHGRCLRLSAVVCPPLVSALSGQGPLYGFVWLVHPADVAAAYRPANKNAMWKDVLGSASQHGRQPQPVRLEQVNVRNPELAGAARD